MAITYCWYGKSLDENALLIFFARDADQKWRGLRLRRCCDSKTQPLVSVTCFVLRDTRDSRDTCTGVEAKNVFWLESRNSWRSVDMLWIITGPGQR